MNLLTIIYKYDILNISNEREVMLMRTLTYVVKTNKGATEVKTLERAKEIAEMYHGTIVEKLTKQVDKSGKGMYAKYFPKKKN